MEETAEVCNPVVNTSDRKLDDSYNVTQETDSPPPKQKRLARSEKKRLKRQQLLANRKEVRKEKRLAKRNSKPVHAGKSNSQVPDGGSTKASVSGEMKVSDIAESCTETERRVSGEIKEMDIVDEGAKTDGSNWTIEDESGRRCKGHLLRIQRHEEIQSRCKEALVTGQRVCIDCSLGDHMNRKECSKLAQQIGRLYGSNRKAESPLHIYLSGLKKDGFIYSECVRKNMGFDEYIMDICEENYNQLFQKEEMVYLTPDSENVLESLDKSKVYIIGGLVDETAKKKISISSAEKLELSTARFPIDQYMTKADTGNYKKALTVNQVVDILLMFGETGDWTKSLASGVPKRTGFVLKDTE